MEKNILAAISNRTVPIANTWGGSEKSILPSDESHVLTSYDAVVTLHPQNRRNGRSAKRIWDKRLARGPVCHCHTNPKARQLLHRNESPGLDRESKHERSCFCYLTPTVSSKRITGDFALFKRIVKWDIAISYSTRGMFQSLQIFPSLSIQGMVPLDSPAFQLLRETVPKVVTWHAADITVRHSQLRQCLRDIQELYIAGEASPTDVTPDGHDLLSVRYVWLSRSTLANAKNSLPSPP
jgi:hypothetical protein